VDTIEVMVDVSVSGGNPRFQGNGWDIDAIGTLTVFSGSRSGGSIKKLGSFNVGKWVKVTRLAADPK
jgi:hypothetical protein